jgi:hypothetical protein
LTVKLAIIFISSVVFVFIGYKFPQKIKIVGQSFLGSYLIVLGVNDFVGGISYLQNIDYL